MKADAVKVLILSLRDQRLIQTVIQHRTSQVCVFQLLPLNEPGQPDILIVDSNDPGMRKLAATLFASNRRMHVIYLMLNGAQVALGRHEHELLYVHIVSHLMPLLERIGKRILNKIKRAAAARQAGNVVKLVPAQPTGRFSALVVDDSPTVRTQLMQTLQRMGLRCDSSIDGESALDQLEAHRYDIVFVDVVMPDMDGYKLTREIKRRPQCRNTPVVILTSRSSPFDRARGALAGCDSYLTKPVQLKAFYETTLKNLRAAIGIGDAEQWITDPSIGHAPSEPNDSPVTDFGDSTFFSELPNSMGQR